MRRINHESRIHHYNRSSVSVFAAGVAPV